METKDYILLHCRRYPAAQPEDLLKALHQSVFGCGHFVDPAGGGLERLLAEAAAAADAPAEAEPLDGSFCRAHLGLLRQGLSPQTLFRLFCLSAQTPCGTAAAAEEKLAVLLQLADAGQLPFPAEKMHRAAENWRAAGYPARSHSETFRKAYRPAYRVIRKEFAHLLPLLTDIDRGLAEKGRLLVAVEGGAAAGKSTLGALLERIYGCTLLHADDYFLQPHQRTAARLAEPGGNLDRERLERELLQPWRENRPAVWRRYDCHTQRFCPAEETTLRPLTVLEGAYSMHPALAGYYDLSVFLRVSPALQAARIRRRNTPDMAARFFSTWLPLEEQYFTQLDVENRCDLILEVEE